MTHLRFDNQTRSETDQAVISNLGRKGWEIYTPDPEPEPSPNPVTAITPRQLRLYLLSIGQLATVENFLAGLPGSEGEAARIEWEYSIEVHRSHPLTSTLGQMLGLDSAALDASFTSAAAL